MCGDAIHRDDDAGRGPRQLGAERAGSGDPLERLVALVDDPYGPDDGAENHDHYLYGAPKEQR